MYRPRYIINNQYALTNLECVHSQAPRPVTVIYGLVMFLNRRNALVQLMIGTMTSTLTSLLLIIVTSRAQATTNNRLLQ